MRPSELAILNAMPKPQAPLPATDLEARILTLRSQKVMLSTHLAPL
jgi:hypothetical protein